MQDDSSGSSAASADSDIASNDRLLALSDGVFGFALTLMAITIDVPDSTRVPASEMPRMVWEQLSQFVSYVITFFVVGSYWAAHHRIFRFIRGQDTGLVWLNMAFLFCVAFLPYPTDLAGEYPGSRFAAVFYAASMIVASLVLTLLWWYASRDPRLVHPHISPQRVHYLILRGLAVPAVFLVSIVVAFVDANAAKYCWLVTFAAQALLGRLHGRAAGRKT